MFLSCAKLATDVKIIKQTKTAVTLICTYRYSENLYFNFYEKYCLVKL